MSRTIIHAPYLTVPEHCRPVHDHSNGPCTLPTLDEFRRRINNGAGYRNFPCYWDIRWYVNSKIIRTCGCRMCTGYWDQRADRRRDRHEAKRGLRRAGS